MGDTAMDGAPEVEPAAMRARALAPDKPGTHGSRQTLGKLVGRGDVVGVGDVTQVGPRQRLGARGAAAPPASIGGIVAFGPVAPLDVIGGSGLSLRRARGGELTLGFSALVRRARELLHAAHAPALPEGLENFIETLPVGMRGAKQSAKGCAKQGRAGGRGRGQDGKRIARLGQPYSEPVIAQISHEARELPAHGNTNVFRGLAVGAGHHPGPIISGHFSQQPVRHFARDARSVLMGLQ